MSALGWGSSLPEAHQHMHIFFSLTSPHSCHFPVFQSAFAPLTGIWVCLRMSNTREWIKECAPHGSILQQQEPWSQFPRLLRQGWALSATRLCEWEGGSPESKSLGSVGFGLFVWVSDFYFYFFLAICQHNFSAKQELLGTGTYLSLSLQDEAFSKCLLNELKSSWEELTELNK